MDAQNTAGIAETEVEEYRVKLDALQKEKAEIMLISQKTRVERLVAAKYATQADLSRVNSELAKIRAQTC
jgi:hypothetical protein